MPTPNRLMSATDSVDAHVDAGGVQAERSGEPTDAAADRHDNHVAGPYSPMILPR